MQHDTMPTPKTTPILAYTQRAPFIVEEQNESRTYTATISQDGSITLTLVPKESEIDSTELLWMYIEYGTQATDDYLIDHRGWTIERIRALREIAFG